MARCNGRYTDSTQDIFLTRGWSISPTIQSVGLENVLKALLAIANEFIISIS